MSLFSGLSAHLVVTVCAVNRLLKQLRASVNAPPTLHFQNVDGDGRAAAHMPGNC